MAHVAKDGRKFQNMQEGRHYDRVRSEQAGDKKRAKSEEADHDREEMPMQDVVKEHGPAMKTHIEKDDEDEKYSVHSEHEDGHKHSSHGHSLHEAHNHSMMAHGEEGGMNGGEEEEPEAMPSSGGGAMAPPGMES
jgi:hypothetical protein